LHAHLFVQAGIHHASKHADIGVKVVVIYQSGGKFVSAESQRTKLGDIDAKGLDQHTVRCMVAVPFGNQKPDPGTKFVARAQLFTKLPGNVDVAWGRG
jgi:hypothetical protein